MLYGFYGFTAPNLILFSMSPRLYSKLLDSSSTDYDLLYLLDKQFNELEKFLDSVRSEYVDPKDKRVNARIKRLEKEDPNNPEIAELKKSLENAKVDISYVYLVDGERIEISELSKLIIVELKNKLSVIRSFHSKIELKKNLVSDTEDLYFGLPLYRLRTYNLLYLCTLYLNSVKAFVTTKMVNGEDFWKRINSLVTGLSKYIPKSEDDSDLNVDLTGSSVDAVKSFVGGLDYKALNPLFGEFTEEDYYRSSIELHRIGLIGFTPFIGELFEEFKNVYNPSYVSKTYISRDSDLYDFYSLCLRATESNLEMFADLTGEGEPSHSVPVEQTSDDFELEIENDSSFGVESIEDDFKLDIESDEVLEIEEV